MTETSAGWVERPRPASVAARTKRTVRQPRRPKPSVPEQQPGKRVEEQVSAAEPDPRLLVGAAAVALVVALLVRRRRTRR